MVGVSRVCRVTSMASTAIKKQARVSWCASWKVCTSLKVPLEENSSEGGGLRRVGRRLDIPGGQYVRTISQKVGKASMAKPLAVMKLKGEVKIVISWR